MGVLSGLLLIPTATICSLNQERKARRDETIHKSGAIWGTAHTLAGPVVELGNKKFFPESVEINTSVNAETRHRGIFEVPFYTSDIEISATYDLPAIAPYFFQNVDAPNTLPVVVMPYIVVTGLKRGEVDFSQATLDGVPVRFSIGDRPSMMHAVLPVISAGTHEVKIKMRLLGTHRLHFLPLAGTMNVHMSSNWANPNFSGAMLPENREIRKDGFKANWTIKSQDPSVLSQEMENTDYESTSRADEDLQSFGVDFFVPVDIYAQIERAAKYSMLFISLTFLTFFIFEVIAGLQIHAIQYLFVGLALSLFFLLLLSLAEHIGFARAYVGASMASIGLISAYTWKILRSKTRSVILLGVLSSLYAFLYTILQLEIYSLLAGSIGLFIILGLVMFATRNIDWYARDLKAA